MSQLPEYGKLSACDYAALGLMAGLEVHQQLRTRTKLFCHCPAGLYTRDHDAEILRHMRPTLSELGEYDGTALMEFKTRKEILYRLKEESVCTYEMDDAPPFELDREALEIAMEITLLLGLQPVGELHIARKQYLDGSIPTGFQRTAILGVQGSIPVGDRRVSILQLSLEEDSCRELADVGHWRTFKTDRLGMPLVETVTGPDMRTPWEVEETAQVLRRLARATGKVRTGIGAARQDVNVSVRGGTRIEIKGVSRIPTIGRLVHNEALRQKSLLEIRDALRERGLAAVGYEAVTADVTELITHSEYRPLQRALEQGASLGAAALPGFEELLMQEVQPSVHFLREFSDRVRVVACLDAMPNLVCNEQLDDGPGRLTWNRMRQELDAPDDAPIILIWGPPADVATALGEIELRAREALTGVPSETRQAQPDGTTRFERVLPGPDRMYPDTDLPPLPVSVDEWQRVRAGLATPPWTLLEGMRARGLGAELGGQLLRMGRAELFLSLDALAGQDTRLAEILTSRWRRLEREGLDMPDPAELDWLPSWLAASTREGDEEALRAWARSGGEWRPEPATTVRSEAPGEEIVRLLRALAEPEAAEPSARLRYYAGKIRRHLGGEVPGREIAKTLGSLLSVGQEELR